MKKQTITSVVVATFATAILLVSIVSIYHLMNDIISLLVERSADDFFLRSFVAK